MATFALSNNVRMGLSHVLLLLYRYLTSVYFVGDLSVVQFLSGLRIGRKKSNEDMNILTVSGNSIGEAQLLLASQHRVRNLDVMTVQPKQMHIMRMLIDSAPEQIIALWKWAKEQTADYPYLNEASQTPGLSAYWLAEWAKWQSEGLRDKITLVGGLPWSLPAEPTYDMILLSHAQQILYDHDAKELKACLTPGGLLASVMPVGFGPRTYAELPVRFSDTEAVLRAKREMRRQAHQRGYDLPEAMSRLARWSPAPDDVFEIVPFFIARAMRSMLVGELLIYSLQTDMPDGVRLPLLESCIEHVQPGLGAGMDVYQILVTQKPE